MGKIERINLIHARIMRAFEPGEFQGADLQEIQPSTAQSQPRPSRHSSGSYPQPQPEISGLLRPVK